MNSRITEISAAPAMLPAARSALASASRRLVASAGSVPPASCSRDQVMTRLTMATGAECVKESPQSITR